MATPGKNLILLTSHFPYGLKESFIESEFPYLREYFDRIVIISTNVEENNQRLMNDEVKIYRYSTRASFIAIISLPFTILKYLKVITNYYRAELRFRDGIKQKLNLKQKRFLLKRVIKALEFSRYISKIIAFERMGTNTLLYSYWLYTGAHAISMINLPGTKKIARAHGSDLYEYLSPEGFYPLHNALSEKLDGICFISDYGKQYFATLTRSNGRNLYLSRLGISPVDPEPLEMQEENIFIIVSCSNVVKIKRLELIIKGLKDLSTERPIHWIHFGDGPLMKKIKEIAENELHHKPGISYNFKGRISNKALHTFYSKESVDLFLNVSESEGIPVSIMEAQAYGIPSIATDVGGTGEIITEGTGALLKKDFSNEEFVVALSKFVQMAGGEREIYSQRCRSNWNKLYNAKSNYTAFIQLIDELLTV